MNKILLPFLAGIAITVSLTVPRLYTLEKIEIANQKAILSNQGEILRASANLEAKIQCFKERLEYIQQRDFKPECLDCHKE